VKAGNGNFETYNLRNVTAVNPLRHRGSERWIAFIEDPAGMITTFTPSERKEVLKIQEVIELYQLEMRSGARTNKRKKPE
jgi:hypothetical protein